MSLETRLQFPSSGKENVSGDNGVHRFVQIMLFGNGGSRSKTIGEHIKDGEEIRNTNFGKLYTIQREKSRKFSQSLSYLKSYNKVNK